MRRAIRAQLRPALAIAGLVAIGLVVAAYIMAHQRLTPPSWTPLVGEEHFYVDAEFESAAGVLPGQGHAVTIAGVKVGEIDGVRVENGRAVLRLRLDERFEGRVYPDATMLLRPKTGLKDMVVELTPGTRASGAPLEDGARLGVGATDPDVNFDEILAALDADTRDALLMLVQGGGTALRDGGGRALASTLRRFEPLARHTAEATRLVARRRDQLRRVMHNLSLVAEELGDRDAQLREFVRSSSAVFARFAAQNDRLAETLELLPPTLRTVDESLPKVQRLAVTLENGLGALQPTADALGPALRRSRPFLRDTLPVVRDELRPFAREALPTARKLTPVAGQLAEATPQLATLTDVLNAIVDELAYDPPGDGPDGQGYLFYVPWANHNTNSVMSGQDGVGPIRRSMVLMSCGSLQLLESIATPRRNPTLSTLIQLLHAPDFRSLCPAPPGGFAPEEDEAPAGDVGEAVPAAEAPAP